MFFNCNWFGRPCCCGGRENKCKRPDKNRCDIKDKCDYGKHEKCCCHIIDENKCRKNDNFERFDKYDQYSNNFDIQSYYGEYNNLGYFNKENKHNEREVEQKGYNEEQDFSYDRNTDKRFPNWDDDTDCKCKKDKEDTKTCKPIKYICIPYDKF